MRRWVSLFALAGTLTACGPSACSKQPDPEPTATATPNPTETASASASATSNGARAVSEETDDFLFEYSYPAEAGRIPELATLLDVQLAEQREGLADEAREARSEARQDGFPYNKHSYSAEWKIVTDTPNFLSLSNDISTFGGGAHGNYTVESLVWDKKAEQAFDAKKLFASPMALYDALSERFCAALNRERGKRREEPVAADSDDQFDQCPGIDELEVLVGSSNHRTFNRLTLYAGPYVAGPYSEGAYEIDINIDRAILGAVKPEYREAFSARN